MTFKKAKEETYSLFADRCHQLLSDFLEEKEKTVCAKCSESCTEGEKIQRALRHLIERLTLEAANRCDDNVDIFVCLLCPHLISADLVKSAAKGKTVKSLAREMEKSSERLLSLIRRKEKESELQRH